MITYKNISFSAKTFYGTRFEPGEIKTVPGFITCPSMVRVYPAGETSEPAPKTQYSLSEAAPISTRGRKRKSTEPEKVEVAETTIETVEEETTNGNPS